MLTTKVLAGPVDHLTDARYFAAWEVEWLSFSLDEQEGEAMNPTKLAALREWITGPKIVGLFNLTDAAEIPAIATTCALDAIQLGPFYPAEVAHSLRAAGWTVLKEIIVEGYSDRDEIAASLREHAPAVAATILSFSKGGIDYEDLQGGIPVAQDAVRHWCAEQSILLDLNARSHSAAELLADLHPLGFAVRGGEEEQVGVKNFAELDDFFESLEAPEE